MMMKTTSQNTLKHIPQRTCLACRKVKAKAELIRLVRLSDGRVEIDTKGKKTGRGAYLCQVKSCLEIGFKSARLGHNLRTTLTSDNLEQLIKAGEKLYFEGVGG